MRVWWWWCHYFRGHEFDFYLRLQRVRLLPRVAEGSTSTSGCAQWRGCLVGHPRTKGLRCPAIIRLSKVLLDWLLSWFPFMVLATCDLPVNAVMALAFDLWLCIQPALTDGLGIKVPRSPSAFGRDGQLLDWDCDEWDCGF
jgi:hypothetical protein